MSLDLCLALSDNSSMTTHPRQIEDATDVEEPLRSSRVLLTAAAGAAFTTALHIFGGGNSVARPIADSSLADEPRLLALSVWHMVSIVLGFSALALAFAASPKQIQPSRYMVLFISTLWIGFGQAVMGVGLTQANGKMFWKLPQPILLIPVGMLGIWGSIRRGLGSPSTRVGLLRQR